MNQKLDRLYTHIDGFINLHQRIDVELAALRAKQERIEERLVKLELVKP